MIIHTQKTLNVSDTENVAYKQFDLVWKNYTVASTFTDDPMPELEERPLSAS